jgi:ubiquinol-cytochrome c reductase cytochrome c1 subunit
VQLVSLDKRHAHLVTIKPGQLTEAQFDEALRDVVTFLTYVAEPVQLIRYRIGIFVILFLCLFLSVVYRLKQRYWRALE